MISYYFMGLASESELDAHLEKLKAHDEAKSKNEYQAIREQCADARPAVNAARSPKPSNSQRQGSAKHPATVS
jgi:hypothetical protein